MVLFTFLPSFSASFQVPSEVVFAVVAPSFSAGTQGVSHLNPTHGVTFSYVPRFVDLKTSSQVTRGPTDHVDDPDSRL